MRALDPRTQGYATNPGDGVQVLYEVFGPPGAERSVVFLPPWSIVHSRVWKAQVPYFARHNFRVVTFDGRGNGWSGRPPTGYRTEDYVRDTLAVLNAVGVRTAALVGLSAGARWGIQLAAEYPERFTHLVLIGPAAPLSDAARTDLVAFHTEPPDTNG